VLLLLATHGLFCWLRRRWLLLLRLLRLLRLLPGLGCCFRTVGWCCCRGSY
jgi:hypothetical protein